MPLTLPSFGTLWKALPIFALAGTLSFLFIRDTARDSSLSDFNARIQELTRVGGHPANAARPVRALPIDKRTNQVDHLYFDLPRSLRPKTPEEVTTIVWIEWQYEKVGTYTDGSDANVITCTTSVVDRATGSVLGEQSFRGSDPPTTKKYSGSRSGEKPTPQIVGFLRTLLKPGR